MCHGRRMSGPTSYQNSCPSPQLQLQLVILYRLNDRLPMSHQEVPLSGHRPSKSDKMIRMERRNKEAQKIYWASIPPVLAFVDLATIELRNRISSSLHSLSTAQTQLARLDRTERATQRPLMANMQALPDAQPFTHNLDAGRTGKPQIFP